MAATATKETIEPSEAMKVMTANAEITLVMHAPSTNAIPSSTDSLNGSAVRTLGGTAFTGSTTAPDGINNTQLSLLLSRKEIRNKTEEGKWAYMYKIVFPEDGVTPKPYQYSLDKARKVDEFDRVDEYRRHLVRELPSFIKESLPVMLNTEPSAELSSQIA
ncbi:hypothetical protein BGZ61DRAFT_537170 [Ilyonectria robusta]|uniref:uncharacterized protein n=1 Tax=Ilyonectria robusta TaxID=1079257 RepID=UPI001E8DEB9D|nr:uncharacterized protein BGZ61DRAFT_537170 [Ilyonectria robusta]KAH8670512.1 hypothetical protein BGZ61DRAFT_537170 [Ilyonectria robusta]